MDAAAGLLQQVLSGAWEHPIIGAALVGVVFAITFTTASLGTYFLPWLASFAFGPQDLRKKYSAQWAIVTGGSSGIGKAITKRLAAQGLNVVIAAYGDKLLEAAKVDFPKEYPGVKFRFVAVDLSAADEQVYLKPIRDVTDDIAVQVVFSNAGYIQTGLFDGSPMPVQLRNLRCNATSGAVLSHHFIQRMRKESLRGCVVYTSSPAMLTPCPLSAMYGATKAFLTELAVSVAPEVVEFGIDVAVLVSNDLRPMLAFVCPQSPPHCMPATLAPPLCCILPSPSPPLPRCAPPASP